MHTAAARRWQSEQRQKRFRRFFYNLRDNVLDYAGFVLYGIVMIMIIAYAIYLAKHR